MFKRFLMTIIVIGLLGLVGRYVYLELREEALCSICHRAVHEQTSFRIHLQGGGTEKVCCPRCGLRFMKGRYDVVAAEAVDHQSRERIAASEAYYVEGSSVHLCCKAMAEKDRSGIHYDLAWDRCLPSLIAFKTWEDAEAFREQYGGTIKDYQELILEEM